MSRKRVGVKVYVEVDDLEIYSGFLLGTDGTPALCSEACRFLVRVPFEAGSSEPSDRENDRTRRGEVMGMFDYIKGLPIIPCPDCGKALGGWQSKDGPCELKRLDFRAVDNFYTSCDHCQRWVNYYLIDECRWREVTPIMALMLIASGGIRDAEEYAEGAVKELLKGDEKCCCRRRVRRLGDYEDISMRGEGGR